MLRSSLGRLPARSRWKPFKRLLFVWQPLFTYTSCRCGIGARRGIIKKRLLRKFRKQAPKKFSSRSFRFFTDPHESNKDPYPTENIQPGGSTAWSFYNFYKLKFSSLHLTENTENTEDPNQSALEGPVSSSSFSLNVSTAVT